MVRSKVHIYRGLIKSGNVENTDFLIQNNDFQITFAYGQLRVDVLHQFKHQLLNVTSIGSYHSLKIATPRFADGTHSYKIDFNGLAFGHLRG